MSGIDFRYLKAFALTARHLNFSKAATDLKIAQSAVSRQVKLLEESIGEQLIVRSSKKVLLTEKGKELLAAIQKFEDLTLDLSKTSGPQVIKVGILHGLLESWFPHVIKEFSKKSPHTLKVVADTPENLNQGLVGGHYDIIFTTQNAQSDLVTSLALFKEELVLISKKEVALKDLSDHNWIVYDDTDFIFELSKKRPKKIFTVKSMTSIVRLVKDGVGVAVVPAHTTLAEKKLRALPVNTKKAPEVFMGTLSYDKLPGPLRELAELVKENI